MLKKKLWALIFLFTLISSSSFAETYQVTNNNSEGSGSLSWAVQSVNYKGGSGHVINFKSGLNSADITRELTIEAGVTIRGNGIMFKGNGQSRLFTVTSGHVVFDSITFTNGYAVSSNGGAVNIEGANASAEFKNCTFFGNHADNYGGAVCITNGSVNPRTTFTNCTAAGNLARMGGGLAVINGDAALFSSVITGNTVSYDIFRETSASLTGRYSITGSSNHDLGITNLSDVSVYDVLATDENGNVNLFLKNKVYILKLSGTSYARDFIPLSEVSYVLNTDETGTKRPQLSAYDAGSYEATPVPVGSVEIYGIPYMQVNTTENFSIDIEPSDASVESVTWSANPQSVLAADENGNIQAVGTGIGYVTAQVYGWTESGEAQITRSTALTVYVGTEPREALKAEITPIPDMKLNMEQYRTITPEVFITMNGVAIGRLKGWINYSLYARSSALDVVYTDIVSDDSIMIIAGDKAGSADITVIAEPLPSGISAQETFTVTVNNTKGDVGHSKGGGGCNAGISCLMGTVVIFKMRKRKEKKL